MYFVRIVEDNLERKIHWWAHEHGCYMYEETDRNDPAYFGWVAQPIFWSVCYWGDLMRPDDKNFYWFEEPIEPYRHYIDAFLRALEMAEEPEETWE